ncbi:unnamed protein product [Coffea canephora]|uniref:GPI-anchored protein LLG1-like domain-containing protein n=2 Tax=Coffea TaxID=13442 RepID=A0A068UZ15_COFCA|nr:unnamed protein product [Coffea canephora]
MGRIHRYQFCAILVFFLSLLASNSASTFLSEGIFGHHIAQGRNLLQATTACPVNFEFQNYTIITSQCKGPQYPPNLCCKALKDFACPFAEQVNDLSNDCATTMFSYINLNGKYPPGLFASECREGKEGLECPALAPSLSANASGSQMTGKPAKALILGTTFIVLLLQVF